MAEAELTDAVSLALIRSLNDELQAIYPRPGATHFRLDPEAEVAPHRPGIDSPRRRLLMSTRLVRLHALVAAACLLPLAGCRQEAPTRFDEVQKETRRGAPAVSKQALAGSLFNRYFPKAEGDYDVIFSQEKAGFAQAKLVKKGEDVATLSVFDTVSNPEAADKYKASQDRFGEYPMAEVGSGGSAILVADRFQVQIRFRTPTSPDSTARTGSRSSTWRTWPGSSDPIDPPKEAHPHEPRQTIQGPMDSLPGAEPHDPDARRDRRRGAGAVAEHRRLRERRQDHHGRDRRGPDPAGRRAAIRLYNDRSQGC